MAVKSPTVMTQLSSQVETDVAPITPQNFFANRPQFPSHQGSLSVDAMAGPRGASLQSTSDMSNETAPPSQRLQHGSRSDVAQGNYPPGHTMADERHSSRSSQASSNRHIPQQSAQMNPSQQSTQVNLPLTHSSTGGITSPPGSLPLNQGLNQAQMSRLYQSAVPPPDHQTQMSRPVQCAGPPPEIPSHPIQRIEKLAAKRSMSTSSSSQEEDRMFRSLSSQKGGDEYSTYDSLTSNSSLSDYSLSSNPSDDWLAEIEKYKDEMPPLVKTGYFDVLILYHEKDREEALKFRDHLIEEIDVGEKGPVKAVLYDEAELEALCTLKIGHLSKAVERSTYVFVFLTKNFVTCSWMEFSSESCLMEAITNPDKQWCVVPVYNEKRGATFRVPMGLNTLKGISYYNNDQYYKKGVASLIKDKLYVRINADKNQRQEQWKWIENHKRQERIRQENERRIQIIEQQKMELLAQRLIHETHTFTREQELLLREYYHGQNIPHSVSDNELIAQNQFIPTNLHSPLHHSISNDSLKPIQQLDTASQSYFNALRLQNQQHTLQYVPAELPVNVETPVEQEQCLNLAPNNNTETEEAGRKAFASGSTVSGDMGMPSGKLVQIRSQKYGTQSVEIPFELWNRIKNRPAAQQEMIAVKYFEAQQEQFEKYRHITSKNGQYRDHESSHLMYSNNFVHNENPEIPRFSLIGGEQSDISSYPGNTFVHSSADDDESLNSGIPVGCERSYSPDQVPYLSGLAIDGPPSQTGQGSNPVNRALGREPRTENEDTVVKNKGQSARKETKEKKSKKKEIHYHVNIYSASAVQVGDQNLAQTGQQSYPSGSSSDDESEENRKPAKIKKKNGKSSRHSETQRMQVGKDSEIEDQDDVIAHGEQVPTELSSSDTSTNNSSSRGSCNVDAAPSTHIPSADIANANTDIGTNLKSASPLTNVKEEMEESVYSSQGMEGVKPGSNLKQSLVDKRKEIAAKPKDTFSEKSVLEDSVNMKSSLSLQSKSSEKQKSVVDVSPHHWNFPERKEKPTKVVAAVKPMIPLIPAAKIEGSSRSEEDTCVKSVASTENTDVKTVLTNVSDEENADQDETCLKVVEGHIKESSECRKEDNSGSCKNSVPAQLLIKTKRHETEDFVLKENSSRAEFTHTQYSNTQNLFFRNTFEPLANDEPEDELEPPAGREVKLEDSPLSQQITNESGSTDNFTPQTGSFAPNSSENPSSPDIEYDFPDSDLSNEFERGVNLSAESKTNSDKFNRSQKTGKDGCIIS